MAVNETRNNKDFDSYKGVQEKLEIATKKEAELIVDQLKDYQLADGEVITTFEYAWIKDDELLEKLRILPSYKGRVSDYLYRLLLLTRDDESNFAVENVFMYDRLKEIIESKKIKLKITDITGVYDSDSGIFRLAVTQDVLNFSNTPGILKRTIQRSFEKETRDYS